MTHSASALLAHHPHSGPSVCEGPWGLPPQCATHPSSAYTLHGIPALGTGHPFSQALTPASPRSQLAVAQMMRYGASPTWSYGVCPCLLWRVLQTDLHCSLIFLGNTVNLLTVEEV